MERVENSSRIGDATYSPGGGRSAAGSDDDSSEEGELEVDLGEPNDEPSVEQTGQPSELIQTRGISFFA
jgi:hypothetical protein